MPNWVDNTLTISGKPEDLRAFAEKAKTPYDLSAKTGLEEGLYFWNFIKPSESVDYENNWYDWNIENWDTKWDACYVDVSFDIETDKEITYFFQTAWSIPEAVYTAMVRQHPELTFYVFCQEEQGWGREYEGKNGVLTVLDDWDIPQSHADCEERKVTCACEWAEEPTNYYPDCPDYVAPEPTLADKIKDKIIEGSGVSKEWADKHLVVSVVKL